MHPAYRDLIFNRAAMLVGAAQAVRNIKNTSLRGTLRELVVRELIQPLLPPQFLVGSGEIISSYGETSTQMDIIIADRRILPAMLVDQTSGVFPIESVLTTIEVKSTLNATDLQNAENAAASLTYFRHAPPVGGGPRVGTIEHVVPLIFAFDTDLSPTGSTEIERYEKMLSGAYPNIKGFCVVERGFWFHASGTWHHWSTGALYEEVVGFVISLVNTIERIASTRQQPDMRAYAF